MSHEIQTAGWLPMPEANPLPRALLRGYTFPMRAIDSDGNVAFSCDRLTGNCCEFKADRYARIRRIQDSRGRVMDYCDHRIFRGQVLILPLVFDLQRD